MAAIFQLLDLCWEFLPCGDEAEMSCGCKWRTRCNTEPELCKELTPCSVFSKVYFLFSNQCTLTVDIKEMQKK
jgi:hypothetical protein